MKKRISESIADAWGVPKEVIMNIPKLTIAGASEIYIENHKGILSYTDTEIRVSTPMGIVRVFGNGLFSAPLCAFKITLFIISSLGFISSLACL